MVAMARGYRSAVRMESIHMAFGHVLHEQIGFRGAGIDADSTVGQLSGGERQGIAIGRAAMARIGGV